jgi:hypothetical protein
MLARIAPTKLPKKADIQALSVRIHKSVKNDTRIDIFMRTQSQKGQRMSRKIFNDAFDAVKASTGDRQRHVKCIGGKCLLLKVPEGQKSTSLVHKRLHTLFTKAIDKFFGRIDKILDGQSEAFRHLLMSHITKYNLNFEVTQAYWITIQGNSPRVRENLHRQEVLPNNRTFNVVDYESAQRLCLVWIRHLTKYDRRYEALPDE